jgi:hypothetical protein
MCNPRRVTVTATRDIAEAWRREVSRTAELSEHIVGEARLRQALSSRLGTPALRALEARLVAGTSGWRAVAEGYRYEVEGGYVLYRLDEQVLEIVATLADVVTAQGMAQTVLAGEIRDTLSASAERRYYEDAYTDRSEVRAREEAESEVQSTLTRALQDKLQQAQQQAEAVAAGRLQAEAQAAARQELEHAAAERQTALARQAETHLETVGLRCRQAFNQLLAQAYRDAILAYARRHGAEGISCRDAEGVLEIEFFVDG